MRRHGHLSEAGSPPTQTIDPEPLRRVLGHLPTGVTIVTGHNAVPVGMSCNSFTSLSLDPPLVLFCPGRSSTTWPQIRQSGAFCVNFLPGHQEMLARRFATMNIDRFEGVGWLPGVTGAPILGEALAWVECLLEREDDGGDHTIVIGRVVALGVREWSTGLVFFKGGYTHATGSRAAPREADAFHLPGLTGLDWR